MALISTACRPENAAAVASASQYQEAQAGLGEIDLSEYKIPEQYNLPPAYPSGGGFWNTVQDLVKSWSTTGQQILTAQNIPRGVYSYRDPRTGALTQYVQPEGSTVTLPVGGGTFQAQANTGFGMVLVAGAAALVLFMMMRRK